MMRFMRLFLWNLLIAALLSVGCSRPAEPAPTTRPTPTNLPNIVIVTIDTLRADHLSCYGYDRPTTPFIDEIAARGCVFRNAYSTAPWTAPAMASLFTGVYPREHGVLHGTVAGERSILHQEQLAPSFTTVPEAFKRAGYRTFGVLSNGHTSRETGFDQGFDELVTLWFDKSPAPNAAAERMKERLAGSSPFFFWIHYFDTHAPYLAREPWISRYSTNGPSCELWAAMPMRELRNRLIEIQRDPAAPQALRDLYDSEINFCDRNIRDLFAALPLGGNTIVVITSDHGEEFTDHGGVGHGDTLYEEVVHVPLIIAMPPGIKIRESVDQPVSNKELLATLIEAVGLELTADIPGISLWPLITGGTRPDEPVFMELDRGPDWKGLRLGRWKFMLRGKKGKAMLFDLQADPGEVRSLAKRQAAIAADLLDRLQGWMRQRPVFAAPVSSESLNDGQRESLRSLGYTR